MTPEKSPPRPHPAKYALRRQMRQRLAHLTAEDRAARSRAICAHLATHLAKAVAWIAFMPLPDEPDLLPLLRERWSAGNPVVLPRVAESDLILHLVQGEDDLVTGVFGVLEPHPNLPRWAGGSAVCLVPGLAFDSERFRLGRGKGFYDRLMTGFGPEVETIGIFFASQQVDTLPRDSWDRKLDAILTEHGRQT